MVEGRRENIWFGVPMPSSMPRVTATPLVDTVTLLQGRESGAIEQFPLAAIARGMDERIQRYRWNQREPRGSISLGNNALRKISIPENAADL